MGRIGKFLDLTAGDWKEAIPMKKETGRGTEPPMETIEERVREIVREEIPAVLEELGISGTTSRIDPEAFAKAVCSPSTRGNDEARA